MAVDVAADVTEDAEDEDAVGEVCPILKKHVSHIFSKLRFLYPVNRDTILYHNLLVSKPKTVPKYDFLACIIIYFQDLAVIL